MSAQIRICRATASLNALALPPRAHDGHARVREMYPNAKYFCETRMETRLASREFARICAHISD